MRHLIMFSLLILLLVAVQFSKAQSVDEIINNHLDALGGKEKLLTLKTVKMEASMNMQGMDIGIITTIANGIGSRVDISVPGMGEGYQILGKEKGWNFMPFQGQTSPEESPAEDVKFSQTTLDIQSPLLNYKEKGHTVDLLGKETVDKVECYKIKLTAKTGKMVTYFIDTKTYMKVKTLHLLLEILQEKFVLEKA